RDGRARRLGGKITIDLRRNDRYRHAVAGAGGHGDPMERDPTAVLEDVIDGKISRSHALKAYGVVITGGRPRIDLEATNRERDGRR
ncbi:MAG: hydantoinase B/oxoprolinase family protein, partial [Chloroflexi bacterium]|nr:hydantoinase B/oxoprolinase family protein [Chloroflexota bacterium]